MTILAAVPPPRKRTYVDTAVLLVHAAYLPPLPPDLMRLFFPRR